jgi:ectoine hydroxylase-related dioxygenase (phytanoyl-CoA dioxygenase family)
MYRILVHPVLLDLAEDLLQTPEISIHGIFNARPKLPDQTWTDTPWHQDAQYYTDAEHTHVVSMWVPIVAVTETNSCMQVAPRMHTTGLHEAHDHDTGFIGLSAEMQESTEGVSIEMEPGDVLCFTQLTPHRALPNRSHAVRWSMDVRFEALEGATGNGLDKGFVARCGDASRVTDCESWLALWEGMPHGTY